MSEPAVRRDDQHAEGHAGRRRSEKRGARGGARCFDAGLAKRQAARSQLPDAREIDEPVVDAVADDDGAEESGLGIEIADDEPGEAKTDCHRDEDRDAERDRRSEVAKEEQDGKKHQRDHDHGGAREVVEDGLIFRDEHREGAGEIDAQVPVA